jgi:hypothetical protein
VVIAARRSLAALADARTSHWVTLRDIARHAF